MHDRLLFIALSRRYSILIAGSRRFISVVTKTTLFGISNQPRQGLFVSLKSV